MREESIYLAMGARRTVCEIEYIPGVGTNHRREEGIYLAWEPIIGGKRVYTRSGNQSQEGREYTPGVGTTHMGVPWIASGEGLDP